MYDECLGKLECRTSKHSSPEFFLNKLPQWQGEKNSFQQENSTKFRESIQKLRVNKHREAHLKLEKLFYANMQIII